MKIECVIDGKMLSLNLNSNKPLSLVLQEDLDNSTVNAHCRGRLCGLCAVLMDNEAVLSCMVPAFELNEKEIRTFETFQKERNMRDIERAYDEVGVKPCETCYQSRSIIIESLSNKLLERPNTPSEQIISELSVIDCSCMDTEDMLKIVKRVTDLKRRRNVRRS